VEVVHDRVACSSSFLTCKLATPYLEKREGKGREGIEDHVHDRFLAMGDACLGPLPPAKVYEMMMGDLARHS